MAKCPFLTPFKTCEEEECQLWVKYKTGTSSDGTGECALKLLAVMALPRYGGMIEDGE